MAFFPRDRVRQTSSTGGTSNLTLDAGIPSGYVSFTAAGYAAGDTFDAEIVATDGSGWETSLCQLVDATHIARLKVYSNSLGTTAFISFTTVSKIIFTDWPANRVAQAMAYPFANGTYF